MIREICMDGDVEQSVVDYSLAYVPGWVLNIGYTKAGFRLPAPGEYFYDPFTDRVLRCDVPEEKPYAILEYSGSY